MEGGCNKKWQRKRRQRQRQRRRNNV